MRHSSYWKPSLAGLCLLLAGAALAADPATPADGSTPASPGRGAGVTDGLADVDNALARACPGMAAWSAQHAQATSTPAPAQDTATAAPATNPDLRARLLDMEQQDQDVRGQVFGPGKPPLDQNPDGLARMKAVDEKNLAALYKLIADYGLPARALVGGDGLKAFWLLVQHASSDLLLQKRVLAAFTGAGTGASAGVDNSAGIPPDELALLDDRIAMAEGRPQKYGSQFQVTGQGVVPWTIEDESHLDERRAAMGLPPFDDYRCVIKLMYASPRG